MFIIFDYFRQAVVSYCSVGYSKSKVAHCKAINEDSQM